MLVYLSFIEKNYTQTLPLSFPPSQKILQVLQFHVKNDHVRTRNYTYTPTPLPPWKKNSETKARRKTLATKEKKEDEKWVKMYRRKKDLYQRFHSKNLLKRSGIGLCGEMKRQKNHPLLLSTYHAPTAKIKGKRAREKSIGTRMRQTERKREKNI